MVNVSRTFTVQPAPAVVIDYLKDFGNAEEWDPGTQRCRRLDSGPIAIGSRWHNESKIMGISTELTYELTQLSEDTVQFTGSNEKSTTTDTLTIRPHGDGSEITYDAVIEIEGAFKLAEPVTKLVFERIGSETEEDMQQILNRLA